MKKIENFIYISLFLLLLMGIYHLSIVAWNIGWIKVDKDPYLYFIHNISYNLLILNLMLNIKYFLNKVKEYISKALYFSPIFMIAYFVFKIILNICYLFNGFKEYLAINNIDVNIWAFLFSFIVLAIFIIFKTLNSYEKKIYKLISKYSDKLLDYYNNINIFCIKIRKIIDKNIRQYRNTNS